MTDDHTDLDRALAGARDLAKRLDGTSVRRVCVTAGETRIEIDLEPAPAAQPGPYGGGELPAGGGAALAAGPGPGLLVGPGARMSSGAFNAIGGDLRIPVLAPLVGTYYAQQQPGSPPFVEVGAVVDAGEVVCIVEAMKLMNEVAAPERGRVVEISVQNGDWVEYEQVLMVLEPVD